jgi:flavin-dependent dehydrogenase
VVNEAGHAGDVRRFNARLSAKRSARFCSQIAVAIAAKHPRLVIVCDGCRSVVDLELGMKPRDPQAYEA